jgi:hypothetical protein
MSQNHLRPRARRSAWLLALVLVAAPLRGQVVVVDEGTFSLFVEGTRIGREDFSIRAARGAGGSAWVAQANVLVGEQRRTVVLNADSLGLPVRIQLETREANAVVGSFAGDRERGIWSGRRVEGGRESAREFRLAPDTFAAETGVVHHLWFVVRFGEGRAVTLLSPSGPTETGVILEEQAPTRIALGLREIVARHWVLRPSAGGTALWEVWTDAGGRLLRAVQPAASFEALRDDPPPETPAT